MKAQHGLTKLLEDLTDGAANLEGLVRDAETIEHTGVPDTPPVADDPGLIAAYNKGFDRGYRARKRDAFIPSLLYALAGLIAGFLGGVVI